MRILVAFIIFSVVVLFHEFGHFLLAKLSGVEVLEFSLGMGPRLVSAQWGETRYSIKAFPLGGSCMMKGEDTDDAEEGTFNGAPWIARFAVIFAGPFFNFLLALLFSLVIVSVIGYDPALIMTVAEGSPAAEAGLSEGDIVTSFRGERIDMGKELYLRNNLEPIESGKEITLTVNRDGEKKVITYIPEDYVRFLIGITFDVDSLNVAYVSSNTPAAESGIQAGDSIYALNDVIFESQNDYFAYIQEHPLGDEPVKLTYVHDGLDYDVTLKPKEYRVPMLGFDYNIGYTGTENILQTMKYSVLEVKYYISATILGLRELVLGKYGIQDLSGPVGVVDVIGDTYEESKNDGPLMVLMNMLNMAILLSANLGVMNLLPIPALDGGRLLFLIIEAIRRKPVDRDKEGMVHFIGFAALMLLMLVVMYQDIVKIFF